MKIQEVAANWRRQFAPCGIFLDRYPTYSERIGFSRQMTKKEISEALDALDGNTATEDEIANIIGNRMWTSLRCDECGKESEKVMVVGFPLLDGEIGEPIQICEECLKKALSEISKSV